LSVEKIIEGVDALVEVCHGNSSEAGWWIDKKTGLPIDPTDGNVFGNKISLIHSEISEALEGRRKNQMDDHLPHRPMAEVELADAIIRICDLAGALEYDLAGAIVEKLEYNKVRLDHKLENRMKEGGKEF
jgi:hypothetical protein